MKLTKDGKFFLLALIIVVADQIIKFLIKHFSPDISVIGNFLRITYVHNYGAGFGILQGQRIFLIMIPVGVIAGIFYYRKKFKTKIETYSLALILGGAAGNLIDRVIYGFVIDFINFSFWPAFNVADSAITIGAICLVWSFVKH